MAEKYEVDSGQEENDVVRTSMGSELYIPRGIKINPLQKGREEKSEVHPYIIPQKQLERSID